MTDNLWEAIGYIYILENETAPSFVKVGKTYDMKQRLTAHNQGSNVLGRWTPVEYFAVWDLHQAERAALSSMPVPVESKKKPELFECDPEVAWSRVRGAIHQFLMQDQPNLLPEGKRENANRKARVQALSDARKQLEEFDNDTRELDESIQLLVQDQNRAKQNLDNAIERSKSFWTNWGFGEETEETLKARAYIERITETIEGMRADLKERLKIRTEVAKDLEELDDVLSKSYKHGA